MAVIVLDLDGTLLRVDKSLSAYSRDVLRRTRTLGHSLIFATARPPRAALPLLPAEFADEFVVCYNGAQVLRHGCVLRQQTIPSADVARIFAHLAATAPKAARGFEHEDQLYTLGSFDHHFPPRSSAPLPEAFACFPDSPKILVDVVRELAIREFLAGLPQSCEAVLTDGGGLCQIMPRGADKAVGVAHVLEQVGATFADVVAFGDDHNDVPLFRRAGHAVAMSNAVPELKVLAHAVTGTNEEDGVARFLARRYLAGR